MTHEEFRHCVYNQYKCNGGFRSPENCYEINNERTTTQPANRRYSQYEHYYRIKY